MKLNNNYFILRHGGALSNQKRINSSWPEKIENSLTEEGRKQVENSLPKIRKEDIDLIFSSDLLRTEETAQIVADAFDLEVKFDTRLREYDVGIFNSEPLDRWYGFFNGKEEMFYKRPPGGENVRDIGERMLSFLQEIDSKYKNKNILIISHGGPLFVLEAMIKGWSEEEMMMPEIEKTKLNTGEFRKIYANTGD